MTGEVCAAVGGGVYSGEVGVGSELFVHSHIWLFSLSPYQCWESKSNLLQSLQDTTVYVLIVHHVHACVSEKEKADTHIHTVFYCVSG